MGQGNSGTVTIREGKDYGWRKEPEKKNRIRFVLRRNITAPVDRIDSSWDPSVGCLRHTGTKRRSAIIEELGERMISIAHHVSPKSGFSHSGRLYFQNHLQVDGTHDFTHLFPLTFCIITSSALLLGHRSSIRRLHRTLPAFLS
ncbi:unnamed protein product [Nesidiocoris tenuis]|uniref:Uncharacterized protein n=1 Tax=Nesidiocoris tenuis TaxID=355587 RepID=A0A6H5FZK9_9HEMI|nr:unnamed protein product [Nesidiocoris tenuis]